jgi:hypothetical protein
MADCSQPQATFRSGNIAASHRRRNSTGRLAAKTDA